MPVVLLTFANAVEFDMVFPIAKALMTIEKNTATPSPPRNSSASTSPDQDTHMKEECSAIALQAAADPSTTTARENETGPHTADG